MNAARLSAVVLLAGVALLAQRPGGRGTTGSAGKDPCRSPLRCERLLSLSNAANLGELNAAYRNGCTAYPERAVRALRAYRLGAPGAARGLLRSAPVQFGDITSLLYMTVAPDPLAAEDARYFLDARGPRDVIPDSCGDFDSRLTRGIFTEYLAALAAEMPSHPQSFPRFLAASQLFGRARYWERNRGGYSPVDPLAVFGALLRSLYKRDPAAFRRAAKQTRYGPAALRVATSPPPKKSPSHSSCACSPPRKGRG